MTLAPSESPQVPHIGISTPPLSPSQPPPPLLRHQKFTTLVGIVLLVVPTLEIVSLTAASWLLNKDYMSSSVLIVEAFRTGAFHMCVASSSRFDYGTATTCYPYSSVASIKLATSQHEVHESLCDVARKNEGLMDSIGISESEFAMKILDKMCDGPRRPAVIAMQIISIVFSGLALFLFVGSTLPSTKPRQCKLFESIISVLCVGALAAAAVTELVWMESIAPRDGSTKRGWSAHLNILSMLMLPLAAFFVRRCTYRQPMLPLTATENSV